MPPDPGPALCYLILPKLSPVSKDISIKEKKEQLKKASDHDIRQFIAAKKRELALLLEAQEETDQANPPNSPNPNNEANDEDSTSTKATGNKIE